MFSDFFKKFFKNKSILEKRLDKLNKKYDKLEDRLSSLERLKHNKPAVDKGKECEK